MIGIYKIRNKKNNKVYIGQSVEIETRIKHHLKFYYKNSYIDQVIHTEGQENFDVEILEECSKDKLDEREKYWIEFYDSVYPNGYNMTIGGVTQHGGYSLDSLTIEDIIFIRQCYRNRNYSSAAEIQREFFPDIDRHLIAEVYNGQIALDIMPEVYQENYTYEPIVSSQNGEKNVAAILTEEEVIKIRALYTIYQRNDIFNFFPLYNERLIVSVVSGQNWKFLPMYKKREKRWVYPNN